MLCKLTNPHTDGPVWINPDHVISVQRFDGQWTQIVTVAGGDSGKILVEESPEAAAQLLDEHRGR